MRSDTASGGDNDSRNSEAYAILFEMGLMGTACESDKEQNFIDDMVSRFEKYKERTFVSSQQLFWLRDLKDKYL